MLQTAPKCASEHKNIQIFLGEHAMQLLLPSPAAWAPPNLNPAYAPGQNQSTTDIDCDGGS